VRHEIHVFLIAERKTPFDKQEQPKIQSLLEKYFEQQFKARVLMVEVRVF